jgi:hypothetical protein
MVLGALSQTGLPTVPGIGLRCYSAMHRSPAESRRSAGIAVLKRKSITVAPSYADNPPSCSVICDLECADQTRSAARCRVTRTVASQHGLFSSLSWVMQVCSTAAPGKSLVDQHRTARKQRCHALPPQAHTLLRPPGCTAVAWTFRSLVCTPGLWYALQAAPHRGHLVRAGAGSDEASFSIPAAPILIPKGPWTEVDGCVCAPRGFRAQGDAAVGCEATTMTLPQA